MNSIAQPGGSLARAADACLDATVAGSFGRPGPLLRRRLFAWQDPPQDALAGRVAVVTGATSGIGRSLAAGLAALGATVHVVGRNAAKLERTVAALVADAPSATIVPQLADLAVLDDVRELADRVVGRGEPVDVLAHVAGALVHERSTTADGNELTFQVHVVAPFLLTARLAGTFAPGARVLTMSSGGMYTQRLDVAALVDPPEPFDGTAAYAQAKRAQVVLNAEWARRRAIAGVAFHALHPGWVDTPGLDDGLPGFARWLHPILRTPAEGADTALWLSWADGLGEPSGTFWLDRRRRPTVVLPWTRTPVGEASHLWQTVAQRAGVADEFATTSTRAVVS